MTAGELITQAEKMATLPYTELTVENAEEISSKVYAIYGQMTMLAAHLKRKYKLKRRERKSKEAAISKRTMKTRKTQTYKHHIEAETLTSPLVDKLYKEEKALEEQMERAIGAVETYSGIIRSLPAVIGRGSTYIKAGGY